MVLLLAPFACAALIAVSFIPAIASATDRTDRTDDRVIGPCRIELFGPPDIDAHGDAQLLRISREGQVLVSMQDDCLSIDPPDDWNGDEWAPPPFGVSVTGDEIPDLVVYAWCRAAYVLPMLHVFELGPEFRTIYEFEEFVFGFRRFGQDPGWKIIAGDLAWSEGGWWSPFFSNRVIAGFDSKANRYRLDAPLMRRPSPSADELRAIADKIRNHDRWDYNTASPEMTAALIELIYSGNGAYADKLLDTAWNPKFPDKAEYRAQVMECDLRRSSWWPDVAELNGWPALEPNC